MVWLVVKKTPLDKRKVQIGPICIRFLYKTVSTRIFLLSGRCFLVNSLRQKNTRPAPMSEEDLHNLEALIDRVIQATVE